LTEDGRIIPTVLSGIDSARLRPAIDAQIDRIKRSSEDAALLIGTAKELLETVSRYVLQESGQDVRPNADFDELVFFALHNLGLTPQSVTVTDAASASLREILDGLWKVGRAVNTLRNIEGTGHGRTALPVTTTVAARAVVQSAAIVAQMMVSTLDSRRP
jgi:hypothetical protein